MRRHVAAAGRLPRAGLQSSAVPEQRQHCGHQPIWRRGHPDPRLQNQGIVRATPGGMVCCIWQACSPVSAGRARP